MAPPADRTPSYRRTDLPGAIQAWLAENPGNHRPRDIAAGLTAHRPDDLPAEKWLRRVSNEVVRLHNAGTLTKTQQRLPNWKVPLSTYALAPAPPA